MKDARWLDAIEAATSARRHFTSASQLFDEGGFDAPGTAGYRNRMAFIYAMFSGHVAFEDMILRVLAIIGETAPVGPDWHQILIARAEKPVPNLRPGIIDESVASAARKTRGFRHVAAHAYRLDLDLDLARPVVQAGLVLADRLEAAVTTFANRIDPD